MIILSCMYLCAELKHAFISLQCFQHPLAFPDIERQRLFAIHIFSCPESKCGNLCVPVIWCSAGNCVNIFTVKDFSKVRITISFMTGLKAFKGFEGSS